MRIRVIIVDDHRMMREGLRTLLETQPDMEVVGEAADAAAGIELAFEKKPDIVISDIVMPGMSGIEMARRIKTAAPNLRVVALSMYSDRRFVVQMLKAGASGYLLKDCDSDELTGAIRTVAAGMNYITPPVIDVVVKDCLLQIEGREETPASPLTSRQQEVLRLLADGLTTRDIASRMSLSVKTIDSHRARITKQLKLRTVAELTRYAINNGLTSVDN